jgi:hypothetical protein
MSGTQILWKKERATNLTVRLVQGTSSIRYLNLHAGHSFGPLRVGAVADWCVSGEGVQPIHLSLLFDGTDLFVSAASANLYVSLNGQPLNAGQWIPVGISSEICFGSAVLHVARGESQPPPGSPQVAAAETGPEATLSDGGRLRELAQRARAAAENQLSSAPPPAVSPSAAPPAIMPTPVPAAGQPPPAAGHPITSAPPPATPQAGSPGGFWREASLVKKLTLVLLPLAAAATWFTWEDPESAPEETERTTPVASSSAAARGSAGVPDKAAAPAESAALRADPPAGTVSVAAPRVESEAPSTAETAAPQASAADATAAPPSASAGVLMLAPTPTHATPRAAIDAAFSGRLDSAKELYAKLVAAHPDKPELALAKKRIDENAVRKP